LAQPGLCCIDAGYEGGGRSCSNPVCFLSDTNIARVSEPQHPILGSRGEGNLGRFGLLSARAKGITDHALVTANRHLDFGPQIVAAGLLPGHAAAFGDHPQMAVALVGVVSAELLTTARARGGTMKAAPR
jgi:hypothetical protein